MKRDSKVSTRFSQRISQETYSPPVHQQGRAHKLTTWAAKDAKRFREELQRCYRELSNTVMDQLADRGLLAPGENPNLFMASSQN